MPKGNSNDDQLRFLISCIRFSNNGKINFDKVAQECGVVTKGAAAKRYERMMKAHGIHQPQGPSGRDTGVQPLRSKLSSKSSEPPAKKRKRGSAKQKPTSIKDEDQFDDNESGGITLKDENEEEDGYGEFVEGDTEDSTDITVKSEAAS